MTNEKYERAAEIARKLNDFKYALAAMKSQENISLNINWFRHEDDVLPQKVVLSDVGLNDTIRDYLNRRIAELEKEFEEL